MRALRVRPPVVSPAIVAVGTVHVKDRWCTFPTQLRDESGRVGAQVVTLSIEPQRAGGDGCYGWRRRRQWGWQRRPGVESVESAAPTIVAAEAPPVEERAIL